MRTGDLGRFDPEGRLHLTGRLKDLIITGGLNVAPRDIEAVACRHPAVAAAAVIGMPHERWGETPVVIAVPAGRNSLSADDLLRFCRRELSGYRRPTAAAVAESLPVTGIGKVDKAGLRRRVASGEVELVRHG